MRPSRFRVRTLMIVVGASAIGFAVFKWRIAAWLLIVGGPIAGAFAERRRGGFGFLGGTLGGTVAAWCTAGLFLPLERSDTSLFGGVFDALVMLIVAGVLGAVLGAVIGLFVGFYAYAFGEIYKNCRPASSRSDPLPSSTIDELSCDSPDSQRGG